MVCKTIISTKEKILLCNSYLIHNQNLVNANSIIFNLVAKILKGKKFTSHFHYKKAIKASANSNSYPFYWSKSFTPLIPIFTPLWILSDNLCHWHISQLKIAWSWKNMTLTPLDKLRETNTYMNTSSSIDKSIKGKRLSEGIQVD